MTQRIEVERNLAGVEDLCFGTGTVTQTRNGNEVTITKINAQNLPFDESRNLATALNEEKAQAFAFFTVNSDGFLIATYASEGLFSINDDGEFILEYTG